MSPAPKQRQSCGHGSPRGAAGWGQGVGIGQNGCYVSVESKWRPEPSGRLPPAPFSTQHLLRPDPLSGQLFLSPFLGTLTVCVYLLCQGRYRGMLWLCCQQKELFVRSPGQAAGATAWALGLSVGFHSVASHCPCPGMPAGSVMLQRSWQPRPSLPWSSSPVSAPPGLPWRTALSLLGPGTALRSSCPRQGASGLICSLTQSL